MSQKCHTMLASDNIISESASTPFAQRSGRDLSVLLEAAST